MLRRVDGKSASDVYEDRSAFICRVKQSLDPAYEGITKLRNVGNQTPAAKALTFQRTRLFKNTETSQE
jgi:hypothetical protein